MDQIDSGIAKDIRGNRLLHFFLSPERRLHRHVLCLALIAFMVLRSHNEEYTATGAVLMKTVLLAWLTALPYINMYWLVPRFLFKRRYLAYLALVFSITLSSFFLVFEGGKRLIAPYHIGPERTETLTLESVFSFLFAFSVLMAASTSIKLFQRWILDSYRFRQLENSRLHSELDQLKSQITPHFLFNMLNNTHVLIQKDPALASEVILKLSDLLRYQLYDSTRDRVLLRADIRFLDDFLNLEKIRRDFFKFTIAEIGVKEDTVVPPFIFISFVENAVKHGAGIDGDFYVHLKFEARNNRLFFSCENSKPSPMATSGPQKGGLGLINVKRRLDLIYPGNYKLDIRENEQRYLITLSTPL